MDFYQIVEQIETKTVEVDGFNRRIQTLTIYPDFHPIRSKDLMVRGRSFYAIWNEEKQIWSTDEYDVQKLVDAELDAYAEKRRETWKGPMVVRKMISYSSNVWSKYRNFLKEVADNYHLLDENVTFLNTDVKRTDYVSKRVPYPLEEGSIAAYDELISTLYLPDERAKLEWAVGAVVAGDAKNIQKFIVLYGEAGSGKSTFLNILEKLFPGYCAMFEAKALTSSSNTFSTEAFRDNPLVAIQHDGDLSKIEDNTKLNSIISHENMTMHEKYKSSYSARSNAFLFIGTNNPVKITNSKSGVIRRLIDVHPSGELVPVNRYHTLVSQIDFELGAIAYHCHQVYLKLGKNYYSKYRPLDMMYQTDMFFNFIEDSYLVFKEQDGATLAQAFAMYKTYCDESAFEYRLPKFKFREEMKTYFHEFLDRARVDGQQVRSYFKGFRTEKFSYVPSNVEEGDKPLSLTLDESVSKLDDILANCTAQYANEKETPEKKWEQVTTKLSDLDTSKIHYILPPDNHIVIDFDLKDETGNKSVELNLEAASKWPPTYSEFSKGGSGIHLHYIWDGDVNQLSRIYSEGIEIKVFTGHASLRRRLSKCNNVPIATLNSGLPLKGEKMVNFEAIRSEKVLRDMIARNLNKEIHPGTKPSIDFIHKILEDAYDSDLKYDVTDLRPRILAFANNSTNQSDYCVKLVTKMKFASEETSEHVEEYDSDDIVFYDVEVFPNLFVVVWKKAGGKHVKMINPTPAEIGHVLKLKLVGFNCRRYDNHIMYARYIGYTNEELFQLSQRIINNSRNGLFGEAYNLSYTDVYDFSSKKQGLKKFQIELGIHHQELGLPWEEPVPEELWEKVAEYCCNDVDATEAVFNDRKQDFVARLILSDLSGLTPNDTTQMHTAKIIFGDDKRPQDSFIYTHLEEEFPGYVFDNGKSTYRGEITGEGGYVYSEPGMYSEVAVLDIASMHPTSLVKMNMFGPYTKNFQELLDARLAIKHKEYDKAKKMLGGILEEYLTNEDDSKALSYALKIVINIVYGLTSAKFENKFRDPRNKDNIVAKRGALFMIDLKHAVQEKGYKAVHIKTDSIKIPNATQEIIDFVFEFGQKYGYTFEHEETYSKFCLVNDAVYIAQTQKGSWDAVGAQFAQPYVFKTLFSRETIEFEDLCEVKTVTSSLYLDMNENLPDVSGYEKELEKIKKEFANRDFMESSDVSFGERADELEKLIAEGHDYRFIGKAGAFCPILPGFGGGLLCREKDGKYYSATGAKGYRWLEAEVVKELGREDDIDISYYNALVDEAVETISKYGDFEWFVSEADDPDNDPIGFNDIPPWCSDGADFYKTCGNCSHLVKDEKGIIEFKCQKELDIPF